MTAKLYHKSVFPWIKLPRHDFIRQFIGISGLYRKVFLKSSPAIRIASQMLSQARPSRIPRETVAARWFNGSMRIDHLRVEVSFADVRQPSLKPTPNFDPYLSFLLRDKENDALSLPFWPIFQDSTTFMLNSSSLPPYPQPERPSRTRTDTRCE